MATSILRPLSLGEILDVSFTLYRRLFVPLLLVTIATRLVPIAVDAYVGNAGGILEQPGLWLLNVLLSAMLGALAAGASTFVVSESYLGRALPTGRALARTVPYIPRLLVLAMATSLVVMLGLVLLLIPGLILVAGLALGTPALVLEDLGGIEAMGRSWSLTREYRGKVFIALLTVGILLFLPGMALGTYAALARGTAPPGPSGGGGAYLGLTAAVYLLSSLIYPLLYCVMTVTYYDLRVRKEGFDLEVLASGLGHA
ncbi:MAG TPA: YciC family protein [Gemmatimonadales bacterium]|jgi:hypothetical protein|nr:YciC family protein [Gemmatimonadales bacterium]